MTDPVLRLEMEGSREFVITMPGTSYKVTFRELADGPGLSASHNIRDDRDAYHSVGVSCPRLASCQRQGARAGVDRVGGRDADHV